MSAQRNRPDHHWQYEGFILSSTGRRLRGFVLLVLMVLCFAGAAVAGRYTLTGGASANETTESGLRYLLAQCPNHAPAHDNLAIILENKGNFEGARSLCIRALGADSSVIAPYAGHGDVRQTDGSR